MTNDALRDPLKRLELSEGFSDRGASFLGAEVTAGGALVISAAATGVMCETMRGDLDEETWLSIAPAWKDELLLRLLAQRFTAAPALVAYLRDCGIQFSVYTG